MEEGWENLVRTTEKTPTEGTSTLSGAPITSSHVPLDYSWDSPSLASQHHEGDKKVSFQMQFCLFTFGACTLLPINKLLKNPAHLDCMAQDFAGTKLNKRSKYKASDLCVPELTMTLLLESNRPPSCYTIYPCQMKMDAIEELRCSYTSKSSNCLKDWRGTRYNYFF